MYTEWKNKDPGKFERCYSQHVAEVLLDRINDGFADKMMGDVNIVGHYSLIVGKKYDFVVFEDGQGFLSYDIFDREGQELTEWWNSIEQDLNYQAKGR